jgi:hypothetical protein
MTEAYHASATAGASCDDEGAAAALDLAKWLCLADTPTFAIMALMRGVLARARWVCSARPGTSLR